MRRFEHTLALAICIFVVWCDGPFAYGQQNLNELLTQLTNEDAKERWRAAESLARIKPLDEAAIPALLKALDDPAVTPYAARALANAGPKAGEAVKSRLLEKLRAKDISASTRNEVHSLYGAALSALREMLNDPEPLRRQNTLSTLRIMGQSAQSAATDVKRMFDDPDANVRLAATSCYWSLTGNTKDTVPLLIAELRAPVQQSSRWTEAARTLGEIGPPAKAAVPDLVEMLKGTREKRDGLKSFVGPDFPWYHVRTVAATALGRIGPDAKDAVKPLIAAARQADHENSDAGALRVRAARALWLIAPDDPESVPAVLRGLDERYPLNRMAMDTCIVIGPAAKEAVPVLTAALSQRAARHSLGGNRCFGNDRNSCQRSGSHPAEACRCERLEEFAVRGTCPTGDHADRPSRTVGGAATYSDCQDESGCRIEADHQGATGRAKIARVASPQVFSVHCHTAH